MPLGRFKNIFGGSDEQPTPRDNQTPADDTSEAKEPQAGEASSARREPGFVRFDEAGRRIVFCAKLRRELPGLSRPPFPGELGERIFEQISQAAFDMWRQHQTILINHYGLNLGDPMARAFLMEQMEYFLFEDVQIMPEEWIPEDQPSQGAPPVPRGKGGGPAAPRKK